MPDAPLPPPPETRLRIVRPGGVASLPMLLLFMAALTVWALGKFPSWEEAGAIGILKVLAAPLLLAAAWVASLIYDRRSFERRIRNHPVALSGEALCAGGCAVYMKNARQDVGLIFLTPEKIVMDLQTRYRNSTGGSCRTSELRLARITRVTATWRRLTLSREGFDDMKISIHDPKQWRDLIEEARSRLSRPLGGLAGQESGD